jgi:hypothetical protein
MHTYHTIALLTDFGLADAYVGAIKGVIYSIAPRVCIVDISHDIPPQDVQAAAYVLWSAYRYFPRKSVFVAVVDPGEGTDRPIVCVKSADYLFLAPDNGLLKFVLADQRPYTAFAVTNARLWLPEVSSSFHGRDILAPVSTHLASGVSLSQVGKRTRLMTQAEPFVNVRGNQTGSHKSCVIHVDRFGNLITNLRLMEIPKKRSRKAMRIGNRWDFSLAGSQKHHQAIPSYLRRGSAA